MRPAGILLGLLFFLALINTSLYLAGESNRSRAAGSFALLQSITAALGASDLSLSTEARYTRHPAASDPVAPFMDHPGGLEHFPSGAFFAPVSSFSNPQSLLP